MGCEKCTHIPALPKADMYVFYASHDYMLQKVYEVIKDICHLEWKEQLLEAKGNMDIILEYMSQNNSFTQKEFENIFVVPLENEQFQISLVSKSKSLFEYINLYQSRDFLWALENNSLFIEFMPIVDLKNKTVFGYECLSRGRRQDGTIIPPVDMFQFAKYSDLLFYLDRTCRMKAINTAYEKKIMDNYVFINFTPTSIYNPVFCLKDTVELAKKLNFNLSNVVFEVIESEKILEIDHLRNILDFYIKQGFQVALDDIGSGFSSLRMLAELKPHFVKIDIDLVHNIHNDPVKYTIVQHLVGMAKNLGIKVVAEGIEQKEELDKVCEIGADFGQGYYFGKPATEPHT